MAVALFGLLFTGIGIFMFARSLSQFRTSRASKDWPSVEGQVVGATVEMRVDSDEDGTSTRHSPRIIYTYSVFDQQYTSDQVAIGARRWYSSRTKAEAQSAYQPGQQVTVYYDPDNPAQAVLEAGTARGVWGTLIIGAGFTFFGVIALADGVGNLIAR